MTSLMGLSVETVSQELRILDSTTLIGVPVPFDDCHY